MDGIGGKVTSIKYGPYKVPAMSGLENKLTINLEKPCSKCYIVAMQSNLVKADGTEVNIDEGAWYFSLWTRARQSLTHLLLSRLHHMVMYNNGRTRKDAVCAIMPQSTWTAHFLEKIAS
jgi:hypothetical protein